MEFRVRSAVADTPAYVPGKPAAPVAGQKAYKLSSNEHFMSPLPAVVEAAAKSLETMNLYGDPGVFDLTEEMAQHVNVETNQLLFGAGASEILAALFHITAESGTEVVFPWPSFEMYVPLTLLEGATPIKVPLREDLGHDLDAMADAINDRTRLVILCSPNNPTGGPVEREEFEEFMAKVPRDVLVALDQAYFEYMVEGGFDGMDALPSHPNLVVVRTFSKAHGMAGLRVGWAVAHPDVISAMRTAILPFSVSRVAQAAASASLRLASDVDVRAKEVARIRDDMQARLREIGIPVAESQGGFLWLPLEDKAEEFESACREVGVAVRQLTGGVRVSIGEEEAMDRVAHVAAEMVARGHAKGGTTSGQDS